MSTRSDLARTARTLRAASARRDLLILRMRSEGASLRQVAAAAQLTPQAVLLICRRDGGKPNGD